MKKSILLMAICLCSMYSFGQYTVRLIVKEVGAKKLDDIYIAGNFNDWNPHDFNYKLKPFGGTRKAIVLKNLAAGKYEFKFTRGAWEKVETTAKGEDIANRQVEVTADTSLEISIPGWKDDYPDKPKPYTATAQVKIIDTAFGIPQLGRTRRIWIYLPKSYASTKGKIYPVLYMHDGQNLFNERTAAFGEWGIDECLDSLQAKLKKECIVVGIDNGGDKRMTEYNPYDDAKYGKGEGNQYVDFLAQTLKPYIDKEYRTIKDPMHTYIAGSSMGGLISLYAVVKYPAVFGYAGIFSPAFWVAPKIYDDVKTVNWDKQRHFFFYAGGKESTSMVPDMKKMYNLISSKHNYDISEIVYPTGGHNEEAWRKYFPAFYEWLMRGN
ncbi:alpha/beta hydrolase [Foetidibacter luteolus]|uniref:alpha/beta hydrolase n=1 Tax=Foetidibacter luteolus TaxID=2608880 RepID=UPI00129A28D4|nr:alpha/beta hydrolase-fold protein [Foetidibacter luteolus]